MVSVEYGFFFQAEDGIRDADVTGVQTCALPISKIEELSEEYFFIGNSGRRNPTDEFSLADYLENYVRRDRKSTRLNSSHVRISYAVFCLKKKKKKKNN